MELELQKKLRKNKNLGQEPKIENNISDGDPAKFDAQENSEDFITEKVRKFALENLPQKIQTSSW